jgi:hypothetical protein
VDGPGLKATGAVAHAASLLELLDPSRKSPSNGEAIRMQIIGLTPDKGRR